MILLDLRMHRAGVNRALRWVRRGLWPTNTYALVGLDGRLVGDHDMYLSLPLSRRIQVRSRTRTFPWCSGRNLDLCCATCLPNRNRASVFMYGV
jgi:hypothetical protein